VGSCLLFLRELFTSQLKTSSSTRLSTCLSLSRGPNQCAYIHRKFSNRVISITAPRLWNDLLPELRTFSFPTPPLPLTHHHLPSALPSISPRAFHTKLKSDLSRTHALTCPLLRVPTHILIDTSLKRYMYVLCLLWPSGHRRQFWGWGRDLSQILGWGRGYVAGGRDILYIFSQMK